MAGLINAYRAAAADALAQTEIVTAEDRDQLTIFFDYAAMNSVMQTLKDEQAIIASQDFDLHCAITLQIRKSNADSLKKTLSTVETVVIR